jgi:hypothetical protein
MLALICPSTKWTIAEGLADARLSAYSTVMLVVTNATSSANGFQTKSSICNFAVVYGMVDSVLMYSCMCSVFTNISEGEANATEPENRLL